MQATRSILCTFAASALLSAAQAQTAVSADAPALYHPMPVNGRAGTRPVGVTPSQLEGKSVKTTLVTSAAVCMLVFGTVATTRADPPAGVTPTLIGRATYGAFNLQADPRSLEFSVEAKRPVDIVVRTHDYAPGSSTGWHSHPGPVFITVLEGKVTFYESDDPSCTPKVVSKGEGYVDTGRGHIGRNESGAPAKDVTVIFAPVGLSFRGELPALAPQCKF